jgi:hypothetical protein
VVIGFSQAANKLEATHFDLVNTKPALLIDNLDSELADDSSDLKTEERLDALFHEFGHFIQYEFLKRDNVATPVLHPYLVKVLGPADHHHGYGLINSKSALAEAIGSFMMVLISKAVFTDPGHLKFGGTAALTDNTVNPSFYIETNTANNPVGIKPPRNTNANYFLYEQLYEENAIASLLWDLHDNTPKEVVKAPGSQTVREGITISINKLLDIIISNKVITVKDMYGALQRSSLSRLNKLQINDLFTYYNICVDSNSNGMCNRRETMQSKGLTAWEARYRNIIFSYGNIQLGYANTRP